MTVCLISFEYKRTAVKFSSVYYLNTFCSFLWMLPSLYGMLHSPIMWWMWNLKGSQIPILYNLSDSQFTGLLRKLPSKPCYVHAAEWADEDEVLDLIRLKVCSQAKLEKMVWRDLLVHHPFFSKHWNQNRSLKDYLRAVTFYPKEDWLFISISDILVFVPWNF